MDSNETINNSVDALNHINDSVNNTVDKFTNFLDSNHFGLVNKYFTEFPILKGLLVIVVFVLFLKLFIYFSEKVVKRILSKTETDLDDKIWDIIKTPLGLVWMMIGILVAITASEISFSLQNYLLQFIYTLIIIIIAYAFWSIADIIIAIWSEKLTKKTKIKIDDELAPLVRKVAKFIIIIITLLIILRIWNINIGPMLASLGIAGLVVGLALQNTLSNVFSGISLIIDRTFKVGDVIEINNIVGTVYDISLRATQIKTFDNELISIPNGQLANSLVKNFLQPAPKQRIIIPFTVAYGTDPKKVKQLILNVIKNIKNVEKDPEPIVRFDSMADSALVFKAFFWVPSYNEKDNPKEEAMCEIYNALNKAKISIPYPQMDVHIKK